MSVTSGSTVGSVFLKTLRGFLVAILGWGLGLGALLASLLMSFPSLMSTPQDKQTYIDLAKEFKFLWEVVNVSSPGGYVMWKEGPLLTLPAVWGILAGSRLLRGKNERGSLDVLLPQPRLRGRVVYEKLAALAVALLLIGLLVGVLTGLGGMSIHADFSFGDALLFGLDISLVAAAFAAIAVFVSQFTRESGTAARLTGALLALAILLNSLHNVVPSAEIFARLSPVYYFGLSKALVPSYGTNAGAMLVLAVITAVFSLSLPLASGVVQNQQEERARQQQKLAEVNALADKHPEIYVLAQLVTDKFESSNRSSVIWNIFFLVLGLVISFLAQGVIPLLQVLRHP